MHPNSQRFMSWGQEIVSEVEITQNQPHNSSECSGVLGSTAFLATKKPRTELKISGAMGREGSLHQKCTLST